MKVLNVAVCGLIHDGKLPLIRWKRNHLAGYWGLPGGKFDDAEHLVQAAEREMTEEIEQPTRFGEFLAVVDEIVVRSDGQHRCNLFVCRMKGEGLAHRRIDKDEGTIDWFTPEEIVAMKDEIVASDYRFTTEVVLGNGRGYYGCTLDIRQRPSELLSFEGLGGCQVADDAVDQILV